MISLNYSKIISEITNSLVSYISKLEDLKYQYQQSIDEYKKLNELYDNITFDIDEFVEEYNKSKNSQKEYFKSIVDEIYEDKKDVRALFSELKNDYLISMYSSKKNDYPQLNDFLDRIEDKLKSLELMINEDKLKEIEDRIVEYIDFSNIFDKDKLLGLYDTDKYVDMIDSLDMDSSTKIEAMEMGIKEFNRLYNEELEETYTSYNELEIDLDDMNQDYLDDFDFDGVVDE